MEALISWNNKLAAIGRSDAPAFVKQLQKLPIYERFAKNLLQVRFERLFHGSQGWPHVQRACVRPAASNAALRRQHHLPVDMSVSCQCLHALTRPICMSVVRPLTLMLFTPAAVLRQDHRPGLGGPGARQRAAGILGTSADAPPTGWADAE